MKWQEYQEAVGQLYEQMSEFGMVQKSITIPDRVTGQARQIDVWWEAKIGDHTINFLVDAKLRQQKLDVKDIEEVLMLAQAVNANKAIIVSNAGWTAPAAKKALFEGMDLRLFTLIEALDVIVEDKWLMCPHCEQDCIVISEPGFRTYGGGLIHWWLRGDCRECSASYVNCQDCGAKFTVTEEDSNACDCPYKWKKSDAIIWPYEHFEDDPDDPDQLTIVFPN